MAKAKKTQSLVTESDVNIPHVTVEEALNEMSQLDILDWQKFHALSVVSNVAEDDSDVEAPRENESDPVTRLVEFLQSHSGVPVIDILAGLNWDSDYLWPVLKDTMSAGYAIHINADQTILFGLTAMTFLYNSKPEMITVNKVGRKQEVLAILQRGKHVMVKTIAAELNITDRNVSSQLSYLRADGYKIATDSRGYKFLEE